ncbi:MAG: hypothetical protein U9N87_13450 [Planctomycetota bacterium]|nr:hypothetical protein [Planctomycetota bacterium]
MKTYLVLLLVLAMFLGCGSGRPEGELPELYPAGGTVIRGGQPVTTGFLRFRPVSPDADSSNYLITSLVGPDGHFELASMHALSQKKKPGAPAGTYTITYMPPVEGQIVPMVNLKQKFTISSDGPNELSVKLDGR